jgi:hypothetical protein
MNFNMAEQVPRWKKKGEFQQLGTMRLINWSIDSDFAQFGQVTEYSKPREQYNNTHDQIQPCRVITLPSALKTELIWARR